MHANAVECLLPFLKPGANVLDIGKPTKPLAGQFGLFICKL